MSLKTALVKTGKKAIHYCNSNQPDILTGIAIGGVVLTAITAVYAYKKTRDKIESMPEEATRADKFKETWYYWIIPASAGVGTILATNGINEVHKAKELKMIASYNILKESSEKFKQYTLEEIGKNKYDKIKHKVEEDIGEDKKTQLEDKVRQFCNAEYGGVLFRDVRSGQIWPGTYEEFYRSCDKANEKLRPYGKGGEDWISWADFITWFGANYSTSCERIGFAAKPFGDAIDRDHMLYISQSEYNGHICTIADLEPGHLDDRDFL